MELTEAIYNRRSIRKYQKKAVDKRLIEKILAAAMWAPSASNRQGWRFILVESEERKQELIKKGVRKLKNVPVGIFVVYDNRTGNPGYQDYVQSAAAAIQNMLLMAYSLGLGCCWIADLPPKRKLKKVLNLPWNYDPIALVTMGYPAEEPQPVVRKKELTAILCNDRFSLDEPVPSRQAVGVKMAILWLYDRLPRKIQAVISKTPYRVKQLVK